MTENVLIRPRPPKDDEVDGEPTVDLVAAASTRSGSAPFRPAAAEFGPGRMLRKLAGVNELILDWVPEERPRYSRLGAIVLNTGLMAGLSMLVLLSRLTVPVPAMIAVAVFWGYLIATFDGWLVASTHGVLHTAKLKLFLPRLLISLLMGFVIAEPLLLWVFAPAIHTEIQEQRKNAVDTYESQLKTCNPPTAAPSTAPQCADFRLNVGDPPDSVREELAKETAERTQLLGKIADINQSVKDKQDLARAECNGTKGTGLTGRVGQGPNCLRDRHEADTYLASSPLAQYQTDVAAADKRIAQLTATEGSVSGAFADAVSKAIATKVAERRAAQDRIGILDEDAALGALSHRSTFVFVGSWLVRLLLIAVDCMPVLTKLMSRTTTYDVLVTRQLDISGRLHDKDSTAREQRDTKGLDIAIERVEQNFRTQMEQLDERTRAARADREKVLDDEIENLAARLRSSG